MLPNFSEPKLELEEEGTLNSDLIDTIHAISHGCPQAKGFEALRR